MKVLFFLPALQSGGAERAVTTIVNEFVEHEVSVEILTLNTTESFYSIDPRVTLMGINEAIPSSGLKRKISIPIVEFKRVKRYIQEINRYKPDIVISFLYTTNVLAVLSKMFIDVPLIISERSDPTHYSSLRQIICKSLYRKADKIVCQGKRVSQYYAECGGKCEVIPNPINPSSVGEYSPDRQNKIVTVGRLIPAKNHKMLIDGFKSLKDEFKDYVVEIYGEGELRDELQNYIQVNDLADRVHLMGSKQNVIPELNDAACFVLSSDFEGFPNVLIEAMSTGIPVISTNFSSGIGEELISDGENGFLIPTGSKEELVMALRKIISNGDLREKFAKRNFSMAEFYSSENIAKQWMNLCEATIIDYKKEKETK